MIRNLKRLGVAMVAVVALSAMAASSASAVDHFTAAKETAVLTGLSKVGRFFITKTNGGILAEVKCTTGKFKATIANSPIVATTFATYEGTLEKTPHTTHCTASGAGLTKATVDMNGCDYELTGETTGKYKEKEGVDATVSIKCPENAEIRLTTGAGCDLLLPKQTSTEGGVIYTNGTDEYEPGKTVKDVTVTATVTGLTYTSTGAFCGIGGIPAEANNGHYTDTVTVTGYEDLCGAGECPINGDEYKDSATPINIEVS
jgi:hypothetical protein